jgi:hypothetical protein
MLIASVSFGFKPLSILSVGVLHLKYHKVYVFYSLILTNMVQNFGLTFTILPKKNVY